MDDPNPFYFFDGILKFCSSGAVVIEPLFFRLGVVRGIYESNDILAFLFEMHPIRLNK